jgi:hypothetical protein
MLTDTDYLIIKMLKSKGCVFEEDTNTVFVGFIDLTKSDKFLINKKSEHLKIQYILTV